MEKNKAFRYIVIKDGKADLRYTDDFSKLLKEEFQSGYESFSVSRSTIRKYWDDYQEKLSELLKEDPSLDVRYSFRQTVRKFRIQVAFQKRNDIPDEEYQIGNRRTEHSQ